MMVGRWEIMKVPGKIKHSTDMEKEQIKRAWMKFFSEKVNFEDKEELTGLYVLHPEYAEQWWNDFEKFLDKEDYLPPQKT